MSKYSLTALSVLAALSTTIGCGSPTPEFSSNRIYAAKVARETVPFREIQLQDAADAVGALFGTPNDPFFLDDAALSVSEVLDVDSLAVAAGAITRDNYGQGLGLYRQHCVHCHGITGNGRGPTAAFLNPYPRDFRAGRFKFKSTPVGAKPTDDDLKRVIRQGIEGTAMPAFKESLKSVEIDAIVDYVKYLTIRGEAERFILNFQANESSYAEDGEDPAVDEEAREELQSYETLSTVLGDALDGWRIAAEQATEIEERPAVYDRWSEEFDEAELAASVERGKKHYYGAGICYQCHGESQLGDGNQTDYDFWTKEFYDWVTNKGSEEFEQRIEEYEELGGLPIRNIIPRNLRRGVYRGGRRPIDIYWRIKNGIDGTPMPAANASLIQNEDIWDIVNYVLALPYDSMSRPDHESEGYTRLRN